MKLKSSLLRNVLFWTGLGFFQGYLFWTYASNPFGVASEDFFLNWQQDSQALVENSLASNSMGSSNWGLVGRVQQLGSQGHFFYVIQVWLGWGSVELMALTAFLTASVVTLLVATIWRRGNPVFASVLGYVALTSPWLIASARNLYWVPWTLFLPMALASLLFFFRSRWAKLALHGLLFLAFAFRFSTGYEFLTAVVLSAAAMPLIFKSNQALFDSGRRALSKLFIPFSVMLNGALAFIAVLIIHSSVRGEGSIFAGLDEIWREDVLRRTYGDPGAFDPVYGPSLEASPVYVVARYVGFWKTPVTSVPIGDWINLGLPPGSLIWVIAALLFLSVFAYRKGFRFSFEQIWLLIISFSAPLSWFILAKSHSFIHTHINYLLWYPLPVTVLLFFLFIVIKSLLTNKSLIATRGAIS